MRLQRLAVLALLLTLSLAGCGAAPKAAKKPAPSKPQAAKTQSNQAGAPQTSSGGSQPKKKPASGPPPVAATPIRPTKEIGATLKPPETIQAALVAPGQEDTLHLQVTKSGGGTLAVDNAAGSEIWKLSQVSWVGVLEYGAAHRPVVVVQSAASTCGSGGCNYAAYTWVPTSNAFVRVHAPQPTEYRFAATSGSFQAVHSAPGGEDALFGFGNLTPVGVSITSRLYDSFQHYVVTQYGYVPGGAPGGRWQAVGQPSYGPVKLLTPYPQQRFQVAEGLLTAVALGLKTQAATFAASSAVAAKVWSAARPRLAGGGLLWFPEQGFASAAGASPEVLDIWQQPQPGTPSVARVFKVQVAFAKAAGKWRVKTLSLTPVTLKYDTVQNALAVLAKAKSFQTYEAAHPQALATDVFLGSANQWTVQMSGGSSFAVDATTGKVSFQGA